MASIIPTISNIYDWIKSIEARLEVLEDNSGVHFDPRRYIVSSRVQASKIIMADFSRSSQGVRTYDNTHREAMGTITLLSRTGPIERKVSFQGLNIKASFNIFLGRPWIHEVPSSLQDKVKLEEKGNFITLNASHPRTKIVDKALILIEHYDNDEDIWGFSAEIWAIKAEPIMNPVEKQNMWCSHAPVMNNFCVERGAHSY